MGYWGLNQGQLHTREAPYLLYYCSGSFFVCYLGYSNCAEGLCLLAGLEGSYVDELWSAECKARVLPAVLSLALK